MTRRTAKPVQQVGGTTAVGRVRSSFCLTSDEVPSLLAKHSSGDPLPNPHNKGVYYWAIEALKQLGLNRRHPLGEFVRTLKEIMSRDDTKLADGTTGWERFTNRHGEVRRQSKVDPQVVKRAIIKNLEVLQRPDYGGRLLQVGQKVLKTRGCVINLFVENEEISIELTTDSATPVKLLPPPCGRGAVKTHPKLAGKQTGKCHGSICPRKNGEGKEP